MKITDTNKSLIKKILLCYNAGIREFICSSYSLVHVYWNEVLRYLPFCPCKFKMKPGRKSVPKRKKYFNMKEKIEILNLSFNEIHDTLNGLHEKEVILPSLVAKKELDEDIILLGRL